MSFDRFSLDAAGWDASTTGRSAAAAPPNTDPRLVEARSAIDRLGQSRRPAGLSEGQWHELLKDLREVAGDWLDVALGYGWTINELFGSPPMLGAGRYDLMGLALLLRGRPIKAIDQGRILISNHLGTPNAFRRQSPGCSAPLDLSRAEPIWTVIERCGA